MIPRLSPTAHLHPAMARHVFRRQKRTQSRLMSSVLRPFTFHIGASWAGKPPDPTNTPKVPFPSDSPIGAWRDHTLSRPKAVRSDGAGEDFFYVQQVRFLAPRTMTAELIFIFGGVAFTKLRSQSVGVRITRRARFDLFHYVFRYRGRIVWRCGRGRRLGGQRRGPFAVLASTYVPCPPIF